MLVVRASLVLVSMFLCLQSFLKHFKSFPTSFINGTAIRALLRRYFCTFANALSKGVSLMVSEYHFAAASISNNFLTGTLFSRRFPI